MRKKKEEDFLYLLNLQVSQVQKFPKIPTQNLPQTKTHPQPNPTLKNPNHPKPPQPHPNPPPETSSSNLPSYWKTDLRLAAIWWFHVVRVQTWNQGFHHIAAQQQRRGGSFTTVWMYPKNPL